MLMDFPVTDPIWIFFIVLIIILFAPIILGKLKIPHEMTTIKMPNKWD